MNNLIADRMRALGYDASRVVDDGAFGVEGFTWLVSYDEVTGVYETEFRGWDRPEHYFEVLGLSDAFKS